MTALEDRLRESLREHAGRPKLPADLAGSAIRGARLRQRRRLSLAAAAGAVVVLAAIGAVTLGRPTAAPPDPSDSSHPSVSSTPTTATVPDRTSFGIYGVHLDVLAGRDLVTVEGARWTFDEAPTYLARVPVGWLYSTSDRTTRLLRPDGTSIPLAGTRMGEPAGFEQPSHPVVSADGRQVAWISGTLLSAGELTADGVVNVRTSAVPVDTFAMTWIGGRVVLGQSYGPACCGYNHVRYDVWDPQRGGFVAQWTENLSPVYGPVPEGVPAFAMTPQGAGVYGCLAQVDGVAGMAPAAARACVPGLIVGSLMSSLAPDGRHLVELGPGDTLQVIDLASVLQSPVAMRRCPGGIPLAWEDNSTYLAITNGSPGERVYRCRIGSDQVDTLTAMTVNERPISRFGS